MSKGTGSAKSTYESSLKHLGIANAKKWLVENCDSVEKVASYGGVKPIRVIYKGKELAFNLYAEAAYKIASGEINKPKPSKQEEFDKMKQRRIERMQKYLADPATSEEEKKEIQEELNKLLGQ